MLFPRIARICAGVLSAVAIATPRLAAQSGPPIAPVRPVTTTYFGQKVTDPYQWMENLDDPEVTAYLKSEGSYAQSVLDGIPGRTGLLSEIRSLDAESTSVGEVQIGGKWYFYLKELPASNNQCLYCRNGLHGEERLLFDPDRLTSAGVHYSIDYYTASNDGTYVAYGVSSGGSENSVIHILNVATGKTLDDQIDRARFGAISWRSDGRSFYYNRLQKQLPDASPIDLYKKSEIYLHVIGRDPDKDPAVLGYGLSPRVKILEDDLPFLSVSPSSTYAVAIIEHGVQNEQTIYAVPLSKLGATDIPWKKVADVPEDVTAYDVHGDTIFLLTHKGSSRFKVVSTSLSNPDLAHAKTIVPEGSVVITGLGVAKDSLYIQDLDGGISRIRRVPFNGGPAERIALPYEGDVAGFVTYWNQPGLIFLETGWTRSALWYRYYPGTNSFADTGLKRLSPISFASITSVEVKAKSADGTLVPLSIIYKRGLKLDGSHPALLNGYGSYGISIEAGFHPTTLPWLARGGVLAFAHIRGGGEYGEDWHLAGQKLKKQNTIDDFIACGQYLVNHGFTSPAHLSGEGGSAGGITVGGALTQRPDLFRAIIDQVGASDPLRQELSPNGPPNIPEFGTFKELEGFKALYAMDPYLHVKDGVKYPAVLLTTGLNDPRVAPWEPGKMTARLQAATSASDRPILLRVDSDAGHGIGSTKLQQDDQLADEYAFLFWQLGVPAFQPAPATVLPKQP